MSKKDIEEKVSIIIPSYNRASLVLEAVESALGQNYPKCEIIVVDDGSTDNTREVLAPLVASGVIRYIFQENRGRSVARNRGILEAKGVFLAFLDSDDLFEPEKLQIQTEYFLNHPEVGLVHSGFTKFDNTGCNLGYRDTSWFSGLVYPRLLLYWTTLIAVNTVLIPKKIFDSVGLFDESMHIGEDLDMWRRIARKYPFGFINQSLARVRVHEGNTSAGQINTANEFERYLQKAFDEDPSLSKCFKCRALSRMFSNQAYILLSGNEIKYLQAARLGARRAITNDPLNLHGYMALFSSFIGYNLRHALIHRWRFVRSFLMSRNRSI